MRFEIKPTRDITVTSAAICERKKKITNAENHISGADGERKSCFISLKSGTAARQISNREMPEIRLASSLAIQSGKYEKIATVTGITDIRIPIELKSRRFVGLVVGVILCHSLPHLSYSFSYGILLILRQG